MRRSAWRQAGNAGQLLEGALAVDELDEQPQARRRGQRLERLGQLLTTSATAAITEAAIAIHTPTRPNPPLRTSRTLVGGAECSRAVLVTVSWIGP